MNIENISRQDIFPYAKNAKKHSEKQIEKVANSIRRFGWTQPLVVDKNNVIIIGHCRYAAAVKLGLQEIPVVRQDNLTDQEVKSLRIADNKLNESDWDDALLFEDLKTLDAPLIELAGFSPDILLENDDIDDIVPEDVAPLAKYGHVYTLGDHRIMCGDATNEDDVLLLMGVNKADMVFTDPPYNVNYKGNGELTGNHILNDNMDEQQFLLFLKDVFKNYFSIIKRGAGSYVFHSSSTQDIFKEAAESAGFEVRNQLIWNKPSAALGWGDYRWKHEPFFYLSIKGETTQFYGDRSNSTVWDFQKSDSELLNWAKRMKRYEQEGKTSIWSMKRDNVNAYMHPTQKPVELIQYAILNSSKVDDIVVDLFLGSGSTLIAAEKTKRVCYGMELDPKYVDIIIARWENFTKLKHKKV